MLSIWNLNHLKDLLEKCWALGRYLRAIDAIEIMLTHLKKKTQNMHSGFQREIALICTCMTAWAALVIQYPTQRHLEV